MGLVTRVLRIIEYFPFFRKCPEKELEVIEKKTTALQRSITFLSIIQNDANISIKLLSVFFLLGTAFMITFYFSSSLSDLLLLLGPAVLIFMLSLLQWTVNLYICEEIKSNVFELNQLKSRQKIILDHVKESMKYHEAVKILERFDCEYIKEHQLNRTTNRPAVSIESYIQAKKISLRRQRNLFLNNVFGDTFKKGALICQSCFSHNGMAFEKEYEKLSFRCCYCYHFNLSPKRQRLFTARSSGNTSKRPK